MDENATWFCSCDCNNEMMATLFRGRTNIFKCARCGCWWNWEWDGQVFIRKLHKHDSEDDIPKSPWDRDPVQVGRYDEVPMKEYC